MKSSFWNKKKVVVTGANGFIGSHLVRRLISENAEVYGLVRYNADIWRLADIQNSLHIKNADITDKKEIETFYSNIRPSLPFILPPMVYTNLIRM